MTAANEGRDRSHIAWILLLAVLFAEAFSGILVLIPVMTGMLAAEGEPMGARLSIFLSVLLAWVWVCATLIGGLRSRPGWVRGSALTIHVLLFAAGTGTLQLFPDAQRSGWAMVVLALAGFAAAVFARPNEIVPEADEPDEKSETE